MCGGQVSEPEYFDYVRRLLRVSTSLCTIEPSGAVPETLVNRAVKRKRNVGEDFARIFVVFDKDDFQVKAAIDKATANGVEVIISNPHFELWLLLHFQDHNSPCNRLEVSRKLKEHLPNYEKKPPMEALWPKYANAEKRAKRLAERHAGTAIHEARPFTLVHCVVQAIQESYAT
jgi:hypothetical protein